MLGQGRGAAPEPKLLLKLDLFEVKFDVPLDASHFQFAAEHLHYVDVNKSSDRGPLRAAITV